jgi:hypothetical protein
MCGKRREYIFKKLTFILELKMNSEGAITIIKARGVKGQSLFQGLYLRTIIETSFFYIGLYYHLCFIFHTQFSITCIFSLSIFWF